MPLGWLGCACCGTSALCNCSGCGIPKEDLTLSYFNLGLFHCSGPPDNTTIWDCGPEDGSVTLTYSTINPCSQWVGSIVIGGCTWDVLLSCIDGAHPPTFTVILGITPEFTGDSTNADIFTCGESIMMSWTGVGYPADYCGPGEPAIPSVIYTISL